MGTLRKLVELGDGGVVFGGNRAEWGVGGVG